jgi:transcription factor IIIB subunit 2
MRSANLTGKLHPKTGEPLVPLGYLRNGAAVWPVLGASSDDPDDPKYTGEDDADDDDEDDDQEYEDDNKKSSKARKSKDDDSDDDEDDEDSRIHKVSQQAKRYRLALRAKEKEFEELKTRLQAIEDSEKTPDEVANRTITELKKANDTLTENARMMTAQLAFFRTSIPGVQWIDAADVFALADRSGLFDDIVDDDGTVDERELRRALKELARRKPHLVKKLEDDPKARGRKSKKDEEDDEDEQDDDEEPRSRRSASTQNGRRKGSTSTTDRAALAKRFPVLNKL